MANPQPTDPHLRMAHSINEQLMVSMFAEQQRRILDLILRLSWGCGKKEAHIPQRKDFELVGVRSDHAKLHLAALERDKVIAIRDDTFYGFNKNFDEWRVSRAVLYDEVRMRALVHLNLNHTMAAIPDNGDLLGITPPTDDATTYPHHPGIRDRSIPDSGIPSATNVASLKESIKEKDTGIQIHGGELISSNEVWSRALSQLRKQMSTANFTTWCHGTVALGCAEGILHLGVRSSFVGQELERRLKPLVLKSLRYVTNQDISFRTHTLDTDPIELYIDQLVEHVCAEMMIDKGHLLEGRRMKEVVAARQRLFTVLGDTTDLSTLDIGRRLGVRNARVGLGAFTHAD